MNPQSHNLAEKRNEKIWMSKVIITQNPLVVSTLGKAVCPDDVKIPEINSWAKKFNKNEVTYGLEITADSMHFFIPRLRNYEDADIMGEIIFQGLLQRFPGLDGYSEPCQKPVFPSNNLKIWELVAEKNNNNHCSISFTASKIKLVKKFLLSVIKEGVNLRLIIFFEYSQHSTDPTKYNESKFNMKIYFIDESTHCDLEEKLQHDKKIYSILYSLSNDTLIGDDYRLVLMEIPKKHLGYTWEYLWTSFNFNSQIPTFRLSASYFDFGFPFMENLNQSFYFPNETQMLLNKTLNPNDYIILGSLLKHGALTKRLGICPIDLLRKNVGIFGLPGTGKTYLNLWIISELNKKRPKTGVLVLSLAKQNQEILYRDLVDLVCIYGEDNFSIPYLVFKEDVDPNSENLPPSSTMPLQATAQLLMACLDLKDPYNNVASKILRELYENHSIPEKLDEIFDKIAKSVKKYGKELNKTMTGIFDNRRGILQDDLLLETTKFLNGKVPEWFDWWLQGKSVFLDLSTCANNYVKTLLVFLILHMIQIRAKELPPGVNELRNIVFVDEAHCVFSKPKNNYDSAIEEIKSQFIGQFLTENRSKGISMVISDQQPTQLLDVTHQSTLLRIIFNIKEKTTNLFYNKPYEQEIINQLPKNKAHVKFGDKSFFVKTMKITLSKLFHRRIYNPKENMFITQILRDPFYQNEEISTANNISSLRFSYRCLMSKKKFLHAFLIAFGLWNNLYKYFVMKIDENGIKFNLNHYSRTLLPRVENLNPLFRKIFQDIKDNRQDFKENNYDLKKKDVRLFYTTLMEYTKEIQEIYKKNMMARAKSLNKKEATENA